MKMISASVFIAEYLIHWTWDTWKCRANCSLAAKKKNTWTLHGFIQLGRLDSSHREGEVHVCRWWIRDVIERRLLGGTPGASHCGGWGLQHTLLEVDRAWKGGWYWNWPPPKLIFLVLFSIVCITIICKCSFSYNRCPVRIVLSYNDGVIQFLKDLSLFIFYLFF